MEKNYNSSNNVIHDNKINKKNIININQNQINSRTKKYKMNNKETFPKKSETHCYSKINKQINKPKKYTEKNSKEVKDNNIKKPNKLKEKGKIIITESTLNKTEINPNENKLENRIRNIKVNKTNFDKNENQNKKNIYSNTNTNLNANNNQHINTIYLTKSNKTNFPNNNSTSNSINNNELIYNNNKYNEMNYKYNNKTTIVKKILAKEFSKNQIKFKDLKTFCAHIEIFFSLYLKKLFKYFIQKMKFYENSKNIEGIYTMNELEETNFRPIVNVNNAHCALYCSINVNQDKLINTLLNSRNFNSFSKNTFTPFPRKKQNQIQDLILKSNNNNIVKRNKNIFINPNSLNSNTENLSKDENYFFPIKKKTLTKNINNNLINKITFENNNTNINNNIKISPIKELNINLGQLNSTRLYNIDKFTLNKNNNNILLSNDYKTNLLNKIKNCNSDLNNVNKNKLKKIKSAKNDIYIKPKENANKKPIKEIKIKNKLTKKENSNNNNTNIIIYNSFCKINNNKILKKNNERKLNNEQNMIKKIYIKRGSQISNNFNYQNIPHYNSTFINFKADNEKNINDVLLIKEIRTLDNRIFINIKYMILKMQNYINNIRKIYKGENVQIIRLYSISIINNKINLNKELYENLKMYNINDHKGIVNYCFFDNDKSKSLKNIINLINIIKNVITKKILKTLSKKYTKRILLKTLLNKIYKRNIKIFFSRFIKNSEIRMDKNNKAIYHKINYNDDFNTNNRFQTPKNGNKFKRLYNSKQYNLTHENSLNQISFRKRIVDNQQLKESFSNNTYKVNKKIFNNNNRINKISHNQNKHNVIINTKI